VDGYTSASGRPNGEPGLKIGERGVIAESVAYDLNVASELLADG
jgi:hypothetical protein